MTTNSNANSAIQAMEAEYQKFAQLINDMEKDVAQMDSDKEHLKTAYHQHVHKGVIDGITIWESVSTTHNSKYTDALRTDIVAESWNISVIANTLQKLDTTGAFKNLITTIKTTLKEIGSDITRNQQNEGCNFGSIHRISQELTTIFALLSVLGSEILDKAKQTVEANADESAADKAMAAIDGRYLQMEQWILDMQDDANMISQDGADIKAAYHHSSHVTWFGGTTSTNTHNPLVTDALNQDIDAKKADIKSIESQINSSLSAEDASSFDDLFKTINTLLDGINTVEAESNNGGDASVYGEKERLGDDLMKIASYLNIVIQAVLIKASELEDTEKFQALEASGASANSPELMALIEASLAASGQESTLLDNLMTTLDTDRKTYNQQYNSADIDQNGVQWWDNLPDGNGEKEKANDRSIKQNATDMMRLISWVKDAVGPEAAAILPDFQEISVLIDQIVKELVKLLSGQLPPDQMKKEAMSLCKQVMDLFVLIIGILTQVTEAAAKDKAKNEETMAQSTELSAQMGIADAQAQAQKIEQDLEAASVDKTLMKVAKYSSFALMLAGPIGAILVGMILIALDVSGVTDKLIAKLAQEMHSQLAAEFTVGAIEVLATLGGAKAFDLLLQRAMISLLAGMRTATEIAVESETNAAVDNLSKDVSQASKDTIKDGVKQSAELAQKKTFALFTEQNGLVLLYKMIFRNAETMEGLQAAMIEAGENAAQNSAKELSKLALQMGDEMVESQEFIETLRNIATKSAANAMSVSEKSATSLTLVDKTDSENYGRRAAWATTFALGSTGIPLEIAVEAQKKWHAMSDEEFEKLEMAIKILQELLMLISQFGGTGMADEAFSDDSGHTASQIISRATSIFSLLPMAAQTISDSGQYEALSKQAGATTTMMEVQAMIQMLLQTSMSEIQKRKKQEEKHDSDRLVQELESADSLANNLWKYMDSSSNALLA